MHIMAVDDEQGALKMLVRAIGRAEPGAQVEAFSTAEEALAFAKENRQDIAFLDICIGEANGLDLAKQLLAVTPEINIIFTTGYSEFSLDAIKLRASGYLVKPVMPEDIRNELDHLRNPFAFMAEEKPAEPEKPQISIYAKTFGRFELFINNEHVVFRKERAKELLAFLIDQGGSSVNRKEIAANLFEDREYSRATQAYMSQIIKCMFDTLQELGAEKMLVADHNSYAVDTSTFRCDAYDYFKNDEDALNAFNGEYMTQYSWADMSLNRFYT